MLVKEPLFVVIGGRRFAYDEVRPAHSAGTVLLLAGAESNRLTWYKQLDAFGRSFRTLAMDYRDTGDSDPSPEPYTIADLADDAASLLAALGAHRAAVVGVSLGGYVGLEMALRHPDQVEKLALVSSSAVYVPPSPDLLAQMERIQDDPRIETGERMQRILALVAAPGYFVDHSEDADRVAALALYRPVGPEAAMRQMQAAMTYDVSGSLDRIQVPTLVVHGELDRRVVPEIGRSLAQRIPGARFILYPHTGHLAPLERAEEFNRDVLAFLLEDKGDTPA